MIRFKHLGALWRDVNKTLYEGRYSTFSSRTKKIIIYDLGSFCFVVVASFLIDIESAIKAFSDFTVIITLFGALLLNLIIVIVDKAKTKESSVDVRQIENRNYLRRFRSFSKIIVIQSILCIVLIFTVLILVYLLKLDFKFPSSYYDLTTIKRIGKIIIQHSVLFFSGRYLIIQFSLLNCLYIYNKEELKR